MKRTTVKIPDELDQKLRFEAKRSGMTISEITREALELRLGPGKLTKFYGIGSGDSGRADISMRDEEILDEAWFEDLEKKWTREP